jgi:putative DNA primase/helicase
MNRTSKLQQLKDFTDTVKFNAVGNWDRILWTLVPEVIEALQKPGRHVTCPFHGGKGDFRFHRNNYKETGESHCTCGHWDGFGLIMKARGWTFTQTVEEIDAVLGGKGYQPVVPFQAPSRPVVDVSASDEKVKERMQKWWAESVSIEHPDAAPARRYFRNRKIGELILPVQDLRVHPSLGYYEEKADGSWACTGRFPAILCAVRRPSGAVSTLHRTWITHKGFKAPVASPRKQYTSPSTSPVQGAAIKLDQREGNPVLNLAEGLESALAARAITRNPTWSVLNKELLRQVQVPDHVRIVTIWADRDRSGAGEQAALELRNRLREEGKSAVVMLPEMPIPEDQKGVDWNDVVATLGLEPARRHFQILRWHRGLFQKLSELDIDPATIYI